MTAILTRSQTGTVGVSPGMLLLSTTDSFATITTAGYLNKLAQPSAVYPSPIDFVFVNYNGGNGLFTITSSDGILTMMAGSADVITPTKLNHIATYANTTGTISEDPATAISGGNIQAGLSGTAGTLASFPGTATKGSLVVKAVANTGNTLTTISNSAMGQASVISIPDPAGATADFVLAPAALVSGNIVKASGTAGLIVDAGFALHANTTATYGGGGTSNAFTATGLTASSIVTAVILTSTTAVSIANAVPTTNTLTITFSADPGAGTTVSWIAVTPAV